MNASTHSVEMVLSFLGGIECGFVEESSVKSFVDF
jgi:hypothetical protein